MRTIETSSTDHDQQSQCVVSRILGICISELRFLRIVWFYRRSRGLLLYFYNRVRQTRFRRRSGVGGRENAFSASPPSTRTRGRTPSARASTTPRARAIYTARARELDCVRARCGSRARLNAPRTLQNAPRTLQNAPERLQNAPERSRKLFLKLGKKSSGSFWEHLGLSGSVWECLGAI